LALRAAPDIADLVAEVVVMGGAFGEGGRGGNVTPFAEANIHNDPEAAAEVLSASLAGDPRRPRRHHPLRAVESRDQGAVDQRRG
jgi:hypothetical protein